MENFQGLLAEAAQLKQHQLKKDRKKYESLPQFLKSGIAYYKKYAVLRKQIYLYQLHISTQIKSEGNRLYKQSDYNQALQKYEQALGIFRYISSKSYENMKDQDMKYEEYSYHELSEKLQIKHKNHLVALYLNITSCLTKLNKKDDAILSAEEGLKMQQTAKGHYKKAQAYLQYINRNISDIKIGLFELNKAFEISKDESIVKQMYKIKKEIDDEEKNQKKWFKFMFDKNSKVAKQMNSEEQKTQKVKENSIQKKSQHQEKLKQLFQAESKREDQLLKFEKTKSNLQKYVHLPQEEWLYQYQESFIQKNGGKILVLLKVSNHTKDIENYQLLLSKSSKLKGNSSETQLKQKIGSQFINWLRQHSVQQIKKYIERYDLQVSWIKQQRQKISKNIIKQSREFQKIEQKIQKSNSFLKGQSKFIIIVTVIFFALFLSKIL